MVLDPILHDIKDSTRSFNIFVVSYIPRKLNRLAHDFAKLLQFRCDDRWGVGVIFGVGFGLLLLYLFLGVLLCFFLMHDLFKGEKKFCHVS